MNTHRSDYPKDHVSVSQLNLYLMCSLKYRFVYVDQLPRPFKPVELALGTAFHAAIEWWHKQRKQGNTPEAEDVGRILAADLEAQSSDHLLFRNGGTIMDAADLGRKMAAAYVKGFRGKPIYDSEISFRVPIINLETGEELDLPLDGFFDLMEVDETIVELKTAARVYDSLMIARHLQLTGYAYAFEMLYDRRAKLRLEIVTKTARPKLHSIEVERSRADMVRFFHIAKSVTDSIRGGHFYPNHGWQCAICEFFEPCQGWRN